MRRTIAGAAVVGLAAVLALAGCAPASPEFPAPDSNGIVASAAPSEAASGADPGGPAGSGEPALAAEDGAIEIGRGGIQIDMWVDFFCPFCRMFEDANGDYVESLVGRGAATLRVHPIAFLDRASLGTRYSTRAANAFVCVAETAPEQALPYFRDLFRVQPPEQTEGLDAAALVELAPPAATDCIRGEWFSDWVGDWTERSIEAGVTSTPTVFVDGRRFPGGFDPRAFASFVEPPASVA